MLTETIIEDDRWVAAGLDGPDGLAEASARAALAALGLAADGFAISLLACDDARIAVLNADFRGKPQPTNVLSWPNDDRAADPGEMPDLPAGDVDDPTELGDIAIAYDTCAREAAEAGKPFSDHVRHLIVHGTLHLLGFDHIDDRDATAMERIEVQALALMGVQDPY